MTRFSLRTQVLLVAISLAGGFLLFGAWTSHTISETKVGGPNYQRIVLYKDLVADILPPPNYIIESYLTTLHLSAPDRRAERVTQLAGGDGPTAVEEKNDLEQAVGSAHGGS